MRVDFTTIKITELTTINAGKDKGSCIASYCQGPHAEGPGRSSSWVTSLRLFLSSEGVKRDSLGHATGKS